MKIWVGILLCSLMAGCANKKPKSDITSEFNAESSAIRMKIPEKPDNHGTRYIPAQENPPEGNMVYHVADNMPEFPGGMKALLNFIDNNIQYPAEARKKKIQGRVLVQFVVDEDGYIIEPKIVKSVEPSLDKEALRVVGLMPKWKPGTQAGKALKVKHTFPVTFKLADH